MNRKTLLLLTLICSISSAYGTYHLDNFKVEYPDQRVIPVPMTHSDEGLPVPVTISLIIFLVVIPVALCISCPFLWCVYKRQLPYLGCHPANIQPSSDNSGGQGQYKSSFIRDSLNQQLCRETN